MIGDDKKAQILDEALKLLLLYGPQKVNLTDIASRVGLTTTALYHYFPNKEAIFRGAFQHIAGYAMEKCERAVAKAKGPEEKLSALVRARFRVIDELREKHRLTLDKLMETNALAREVKFALIQSEFDLAEEILREGLVKGVFQVKDARLAAMIVVMSMRGVEEHLILQRHATMDVAEQFAQMVLVGLRSS